MHTLLIQNWNEVVTPDDTVYVLGDWAMGPIVETLALTSQFNGHKILVPGNHDRCSPAYPGSRRRYDWVDWVNIYVGWGFQKVDLGPYDTRRPKKISLGDKHGRMDVAISHFPYISDERHGDQFDEFLPPDDGSWLLHGHVHGLWKHMPRMLNVGIDVWDYYPVSEAQIMQEIRSHT